MKRIILQTFLCAVISCTSFSVLNSQCFKDRHSLSITDAWISCEISTNPNTLRAPGHWIMYDFSVPYALEETHFWNFNYPSQSSIGLQEIAIDYSMDGENWTEWGSHILEQGDESAFYEGVPGPDLSGVNARFILITGVSNHGGACFGLGEVKFNTSGVTSSTEELASLDVSINAFPNPFTNSFELKIESKEQNEIYDLDVLDMQGKSILKSKIQSGSSRNIKTSEWSSGSYLLKISKEGESKVLKIKCIR